MTKRTFAALKPVFQPLVNKLRKDKPDSVSEVPSKKGLYVLSERGKPRYIGITGNLRRRWQLHRHGGASSASFAIRLARRATKRKRTYRKEDGLNALMKDEEFRAAFKRAKERIRKMEIRYLAWPGDNDDLAIFEIYAAQALNTTFHNDFSTH